MNRIARLAVDHARWVLAASLLLLIAGGASVSAVTGGLSPSLSLPGQSAYETNEEIVAEYGGGGATPPTVLAIGLPDGTTVASPGVTTGLARGADALAASLDGARVVAYRGSEDEALVAADGRTTYVLVFDYSVNGTESGLEEGAAEQFVQDAGLPEGTEAFTTGVNVLSASTGGGEGESSTLVETLVGALGALIVLAFVFGSFLAVVPLIIAAVSIVTSFLLVGGISQVTEVSVIVQFLIALIGLGVAIDYSLLVVTRWREERAGGRDNRDAVLESVRTAGHSVVFSGVTVAVGLLALVALPVPFLRSVGYGAALIPLVSIAASLTLLPALLATAGSFLDRPRRKSARSAAEPSRAWTWWATKVIRFRWVAAVVGVGVLAALLVPAFSLRVGTPEIAALESSGPATSGVRLLESGGIGAGALTPIEVLADPAAVAQVRARVDSVDGVRGVVETGRADASVALAVIPDADTSTPGGVDTLERVQDALDGLPAQVGGIGANTQAFNDAVYGSFPLMLTVIVLLTLVLLTRAFRSILLAVKAVLLNLLSVGATYGLLVLVWQEGHGSELIWGVPATGAITSFVPLMVFAFLFGLSMDYEVFILARMRESFDIHRSTPRAVVEGMGHTGRLVTSAALILFLSFLALSQTPQVDIKVFATGLGLGILLDATIVRALLVPALVSLFGTWNWWLPTGLARVLRVEPSTLEHVTQPDPDPTPEPIGSTS
ncbi:MAG: MMPL family transporter [Aeromicrobium sp.]